jgi:hypothetical protein
VISEAEREKMRAVPLCGPRVIARRESIGVECLADLRERDPYDLMEEVNIEAGRPIWRPPMPIRALGNLVEAAEDAASRGGGGCGPSPDPKR